MALPTDIMSLINQAKAGSISNIEQIKIGDVLVDVLENVTGSDMMRITRKPVESGFAVTDAAIREPTERTFDVVLTNPEYSASAATDAALTGSLEAFSTTWRDKRDTIYGYFENREIIDIMSHDRLYQSMMIQSITPLYDTAENLDAFVASIHFQEYQVVGDTSVAADDPTARFVAAKQDAGRL
jgi:hypothetical protein